MQFSIGITIIAKIDAGNMTVKRMNTSNLKKTIETQGEIKNRTPHALMTFSYPNRWQSLVAAKVANIIGMTAMSRIVGLVVSVIV